MRLIRSLSGLFGLFVACGGSEEFDDEVVVGESGDEFGVLTQALSETFSGTVAQNQAVARGPFAVQPGSQLRVVLSGTGDADLYVRFGSRPTLSSYDCRPYRDDAAEQCVLTVPANATTAYIDVRGYTASSYSLQIERVEAGSSGGSAGSSGAGGSSGGSAGSSGAGGSSSGGSAGSSSGGAGSGGSSSTAGAGGSSSAGTPVVETFSGALARNETVGRGPFAVQPGTQLRVVLSGTGDVDLYVRFGSRPTLSSYDCRPYREDSAEQCLLTVPANATTAFVDVRGYTAASYSLQIERIAGGGSGGVGGGGGVSGSGGVAGSGSGGTGGSGSQSTAPFVIAVLGSSTAEGEGASSLANSWVGLLEHELAAQANVSITNLAVGGYTSLELLPGSGAAGSIDAAIGVHPDLIVVALAGSNDLDIGTSTTNYLSRLAQVRDTARAAGIATFFVGTAPKDLSSSERLALANWNDQMRTRFSTCWVPGNSAHAPCFIDVFAGLATSDLNIQAQYESGDGIHLNDAGHRVIFQYAVQTIEPYLCTVSECR